MPHLSRNGAQMPNILFLGLGPPVGVIMLLYERCYGVCWSHHCSSIVTLHLKETLCWGVSLCPTTCVFFIRPGYDKGHDTSKVGA
jgi:hypothetical protein